MKADIVVSIFALICFHLVIAIQYTYEIVQVNSFTFDTSYNTLSYPCNFQLDNGLRNRDFYIQNVTLQNNKPWLFSLAEEYIVVNASVAVRYGDYSFIVKLNSYEDTRCSSNSYNDANQCFRVSQYNSIFDEHYYNIIVGFNSAITKYVKLSTVNDYEMILYFLVYTKQLIKPSYFDAPDASIYSISEASFFSTTPSIFLDAIITALNLTTTDIQPISPINTEFDVSPVAWFTVQLSKVRITHQFIVMSSNTLGYNFINGITLSFRINKSRNFIFYKENNEIKVFTSNYINSQWFSYKLLNPFMASEIRLNIDPGATFMNFKMDFRFIETMQYQYNKPIIESFVFSKNDSLIMRFNASNLITGLTFDTSDQLLEFCIYYEVNGEYIPYKDNKLFNDTIVFSISSEIYLYPFRTTSLKLLCVNWNAVSENNVTISVKGTSYLTTDYSWSKESVEVTNNFAEYASLVGTETLYGDSISMQKKNSLNRLISDHFGSSCFTQPHLCDSGFSVQLNVEEPFSSNDVTLNFRPTTIFLTDDNKVMDPQFPLFGQFNNRPATTSFLFNNVNLPSNAEVSSFMFIVGPYLINCQKCNDFEARAYLLVSQHDSFISSFKNSLFDSLKYPNYYSDSMDKLSNAESVIFNFNGSKDKIKSYNSIDLTNLYKIVSNKYFGFVKHLGIVIMPNTDDSNNFFEFYRSGITLTISYQMKVVGDVKSLSPIATSQSTFFNFDGFYYFTGIDLYNSDINKKTFTLLVQSSDYFSNNQYEAFDEFELEGGENQYIALSNVIMAKNLQIRNLDNPSDVKFFGSKYAGISFPIISAGLGGYENNTHGYGFRIQLNNDSNIVATVVANNSFYIAYMENPTTVPYTLTLVWSKQNDVLMLYNSDRLVSIAIPSNVSSHPCLYNEYLLVYADYYNYSNLNTSLSGIKMWSVPLTSDEISYLLNETILDWSNLDANPPTGFKHGSDCYCKNVVCPCETLEISSTVEYSSRLSDIFLMTVDDYFSEELNVHILDNSATYFDKVLLNFQEIRLQQVFIKGSLVSSKSDTCSSIIMQLENNAEKVETKWCDSINSNENFSSPDLTLLLSHLLKVVNYAKPLTIIVMFNGVVLQPGSVLVITYLLPKPGGFIHASAIQNDNQDLLASISLAVTSTCLSFQFKFGGTGFVSLVILGYSNTTTKELAFFYRREGLDQWVNSFISLQNHGDVSSVYFVALKNGIGIGYIALGTIQFLSCDKLGVKGPNDIESGSTYLNNSFFLYPAIYVRGSSEVFASFPNPIVTSGGNSIFLQTIYGNIEEVSMKTLNFLDVNLNKDFTFTFWYQVKNSPNQILNFKYGKEINVYPQTSSISISVDGQNQNVNINHLLQWHYIVVQYERKFSKLLFEVDFSVSIAYDKIQFPQNSSLKVVLDKNIFCFQMYKEILFRSALKATMLCTNKTVENACTQQKSNCEWCNPLYGEWELYPWEYIFDKNGDCLKDDFNKTFYQSFNNAVNGSYFVDNSDGYEIKLSPEIKSVLGFINNGLSTESTYVVVADQDVSNYLNKSSYMFSVWVKHTCEIRNEYQPIISTSLVVLLCGVLGTNVLSIIPTLVYHDNCLYPLPGKSGLWYNFAFVYNETISVYIDGELVSKTECLDTALHFKDSVQNNDIRVWSVGLNATLLDEVFIGDVAPETLFWSQLTGNLNYKKIKQMTKPSRFYSTSQEIWYSETSLHGSYMNERVVTTIETQLTELLQSIKEFLLVEVTSMPLVYGYNVVRYLDIYFAVQSNDVFQKVVEALNRYTHIFSASQTLTFRNNLLTALNYPDDYYNDLVAQPKYYDYLLEYYSTFASYEVLLQNKTFVVISLKFFEDERYPISTALIQWNQKDGSDTNQIWSNQTNFIKISPLKAFTEYFICFAFTTIRRKMSFCTRQSKTFWTAEGEPVQPPSLNCLSNQLNKTMRCDIGEINTQNWIGVPYSYNLVYRVKLPGDNCNNRESDLNHYIIVYYNSIKTNPEKLRVIFDTSDFHFVQLCVFAYAATQGGNGIGVANFIVIRTQSTAPDIAPDGLNATFNNTEVLFEWQSLENDIDVWNDVKAGSYRLSYGMLKSSLPIKVDSFKTVNVSNNQYVLKNATGCHVYIAYVNAYSIALGPASPNICFLCPITKPDCLNPVIKAYYLVDPRTAVILPDSFDPTYFRGVEKSWLFHVYVTGSYDPGPIDLNYPNKKFNFQFSIEDYAEKSAICDDDKLLRFLNQTTNYELTLIGLHPYTSYKVSIQPCNEHGCGNISNPVFFTTYSDIPSCSPNSLYLQNEPDVAVVVSWNALDDSCANGILESYTLNCSGEQSGLLENITSDLSIMFINLHNYEIICCQVAANNINGTGPYSSEKCIRTPETEPDAVPMPSNIELTSFTGRFTIFPPDRNKMNGVVLGIKATIRNISFANSTFETSRLQHRSLPYSEEFDFFFTPIDLYSGSVNILFEFLLPSFVYNVELQYFNSIGYGPLSDTYQIITEEYYSEAPSLISYSSNNVRIITVNWSSIPIEKSNGIISRYIICRSQILDSNIIGREVCFNHTNLLVLEFNLTDLDRGSTHNVSVAACNMAGCGKKIYILASAMGFTDGHWLEWSMWGACSKTCDEGQKMRTRICTPHTEGGYDCSGSNLDFTTCQLARCSGFVLGSEGQTNCTAVCARNNYLCSPFYLKPYNDTSLFLDAVIPIKCKINLANKVYSSDLDPSFDNSTGVCHGYINIPDEVPCESKSTFNQPNMHRLCNCISPVDYGFTKWAHWSFCSETCGNTSVQVRKRNCLGTCTGNSKETRVCDVPLCPVDGEWGSWGNYSECNTTCGYGYQIRTRDCNNPSTVGSGTPCQGIEKDEKPECNAFPCPVDGGYSNWTDWSICSRPCGEGVIISRRYCNNPVPALRGKDCNGSDIMIMPCYLQNCTPIQVDLTQRTLETWVWRMYDINSNEGRAFAQRFKESINKYFYNNSINGLSNVEVTRLKAGSVVVYYTLTFDYLYDQMIQFIDGINQVGKITNISIESRQYYSSDDVSCPPPYNISVASYDKNTVMLSWLRDACINKTDVWLYVYYKDITSANSTWEWRGLNSNKSLGFVPDLITSHKYKAYMLTALSIGNGLPSTVFYFETSSFPPERPPPVAKTYSTDPTEIYIEWTDIPVKYSNGKILGYRIKYKIYTKKEAYQVVEAQFGFNAFTIKNLKPYTLYLVEVYGYNANGDGPVQYSMCKTIEGVPSIPVPNFVVNDMQSISWWSVSWKPIPSEFVNGILRGYRLVYYLSYQSGVEISGEKTKISLDFDIYTRYYKQKDLLNYAIYSVSVAGFTAAGSGPAPEYQARTCKCPELLFANLYIKKPFTSINGDLNPSGFFLKLLQEMVVKSCGSCQGYSSSKLYFNQSKTGDETIKSSEFDLKNAINKDVDLSFPIYGMNGREVAPDSEFSVLLMSPGIALVVRNENTINQVINKMLLGVLNVWPVLLISYAIASIFGIAIWFTDQFSNPEQFSKGSSLRGPLSGFWFTFVTMTTIGYGDLSPRSILSRTFAMVWFLTGLILNGIIIAFIVTNLTTLSSSKDYMLYNTKVAALNNSLELKLAITNNAEVSQVRYTDISSMLEDLQNKVVDIVYVDTLLLLGYQSVLDEKSLTIISLDNINTGYGFVMSGSSVVLTIDIDSFIGSKSNEISAFATSLRSEIPNLAVQDSSQIIADIFSETSPAFQSSLIYLGIMIILFIVCAFTFEFIMRRKKSKIGVDAAFKDQLFELRRYISDFRDEFAKVSDQIMCQHDEERVLLADLKRFYKNKVKRIGVYETERLVAMNDKYRFNLNNVIFKHSK